MDNELPNFSDEQLRELKTQYNRAKELLEKITALHIKYDAAINSFETRSVDVDRAVTDVREKATSVENLRADSINIVNEIKSNLEKVQSSISQVEEGYAKFQNILGKVEGKEGEIEGLTSTATGLKNDIEASKATAQQRLQEIDQLLTQVQEKLGNIQQAYEKFVAVHAQIIDENSGLQAVLNQSTELQKKSAEVFSEIKTYSEESKKLVDQIQENKNVSDTLKKQIEDNLANTEENKSRIKEVTDLITDTGFANAFQNREKILRTASNWWLVVFGGSLVLLAIMLYLLFKGDPTVPEINIIIYRLTLTSPLLFLIGFAVKQYGEERKLTERYAFKATIAAVMRNHADFLVEVHDKAGIENSTFLRETLKDIYGTPYDKGYHLDELKKGLKEALDNRFSKKGKLPEFILGIKELKELIPDDETLKSVLGIYDKIK